MRVLDTDVCVEILRGNECVIARREEVQEQVATTWMTAAELLFGATGASNPKESRARVLKFLESLQVLGPGAFAADHYARIRRDLEAAGKRIEDADVIVAAITMAHEATLVTGNRRHFSRIDGLAIEDWLRD